MRIKKTLLFLSCFTLCAAMATLFAYRAQVILKSGNLLVLVEKKLQEAVGEKVSLGSVGIELYKGPLLTLSDLSVGEPGRFQLAAGAAYITLSKWDLLLGEISVDAIRLEHPDFTLPPGPFPVRDSGTMPPLPRIELVNGSLTFPLKGEQHLLKAVDGEFHQGRFELTASFKNAPLEIKGRLEQGGWEAAASIRSLPLAQLHEDVSGNAVISLTLSKTPEVLNAAVTTSISEPELPGPGIKVKRAKITARARLDKEAVTLPEFTLETPVVNISGNAKLTGGEKLALKMQSSRFDYEALVRYIPPHLLPGWLNILLRKQIRSGKSRFTNLSYTGTLSDLSNPEAFAGNLSIEMEVNGQSFGSPAGPHRVTGITGKFHFRSGGIEVRNISGKAGGSRLKSVDLFFPQIMGEKFRLKVGADLDMEASDFLLAWRAILEPMYIDKLLSPVTKLRKGRIKGRALFEQVGYIPEGMGISGTARLTDCTLMWNDNSLENLNITAVSKKPGGPVRVDGSLAFNGFPVKSIELSVDDIFGKQPYRFSLESDRLPENRYLGLSEDAVVTLSGDGAGPDVSARLSAAAKEILLPGRTLSSPSPLIHAEGALSAVLYPALSIDLTQVRVASGNREARLDAHIDRDGCLLGIKGEVDLLQTAPEPREPFTGGVQVWIDLLDTAPVRGSLYLDKFKIFSGEKAMTFSGPAVVKGPKLITEGMDANLSGLRLFLSGALDFGETPAYSGDMEIKGLKLERGKAPGEGLPELFDARVRLTLVDSDLFGMPSARGTADARLEKGRLTLTNTNLELPDGTLKGTVALGGNRETTFEMEIDLAGADMEKYLSLTGNSMPSLEGTMDLSGSLYGTMDNLSGKLNFKARKGHIKKYALLSKIFGTLNVYKILKSGGAALVEYGFPYNKISSTFTVENGVFSFDDFSMDSNSLPVSAVGHYNLHTDELDAVMAVQALETVDRALGFVPVLGWILTGKDHRLFVVNLKIKGRLDDPSVMIMPIDTVSKPVTDTLLRILKLPGELITDPGRVIIPGGKSSEK